LKSLTHVLGNVCRSITTSALGHVGTSLALIILSFQLVGWSVGGCYTASFRNVEGVDSHQAITHAYTVGNGRPNCELETLYITVQEVSFLTWWIVPAM